jgi:hypothetical protein
MPAKRITLDDRYGRWTVIDQTNQGDGKALCRCECGTERRVLRHKLTSGQSTSCGCYRNDFLRGKDWPDLAPERDAHVEPGARFGRWTVLTHPEAGHNRAAWCRCDCGTERKVAVINLLSGKSKSCGCLLRDAGRARYRSAS